MNADKSALSLVKIISSKDECDRGNNGLAARFRFACLVVSAFDKKSISKSDSKFYSKKASELLKIGEIKVSPFYGYIVARLGLIHQHIGDLELAGARRYYEARMNGVAANVLARVLVGHPSGALRASSLQYALEAQKKQSDSVKLRWLVGGAFFEKALYTGDKVYYKAAIKEYEVALDLAKLGKDKDYNADNLDSIRFYLKRAREAISK